MVTMYYSGYLQLERVILVSLNSQVREYWRGQCGYLEKYMAQWDRTR